MTNLKLTIFTLFLGVLSNVVSAQTLKVQSFGNPHNEPLIFLHGGPGFNSVAFEKTTAKELSNHNFFVISYDRRGEGRNNTLKANYNFNEVITDLNTIFNNYNLKKATLIGHSFGGVLATLFAEKYPKKVGALVLLSTPISMQESLNHILISSKEIYNKKNDSVNLEYIRKLEHMNKSSLEYYSFCLMHAMSNGFYQTKNPNERGVRIYSAFKTDTELKEYGTKMDYLATQMFWQNEQFTTISIKGKIKELLKNNMKIYAIYGKEDGLYSEQSIKELETILKKNHLQYLDDCSHNIFIDQQIKFFELLKKWI